MLAAGRLARDAARSIPAATLALMGAHTAQSDIEIDPADLAARLEAGEDVQLLDVRETYEREAGRIEPSLHAELSKLADAAPELDRDRPVIVYCRAGVRSLMATQALRGAGFDAWSMRGGLLRWAAEGRPLAPEGGTVADH